MSCHKPDKHENTKGDVTCKLKSQVLEDLRQLTCGSAKKCTSKVEKAHGEEEVDHVHQTQDHVADLGLIIAIACEHQDTRHHVVSKHLPMILSLLLNVHDHNLLQPEAELDEIVPFHRSLELSVGPAGPKLSNVHPMLLGVHDILFNRELSVLPDDISDLPCQETRRLCNRSGPSPALRIEPCLFAFLSQPFLPLARAHSPT